MKQLFFSLLTILPILLSAQMRIPKDANRFTYYQFEYGEQTDTTIVTVLRNGNRISILSPKPDGALIQGYAQSTTMVDYDSDSIMVTAVYPDTAYFYRTAFSRSDLEWKVEGNKHTCSVNSNTLVFEMDEHTSVNVTPLPYYGINKGIMTAFTRNGQLRLKLAKAERVKNLKDESFELFERTDQLKRVSPRQLDRIMKERLVVTTSVFDRVQLHWGEKNAHFEEGVKSMPIDSVFHFAGGTLALKRIHLPSLPSHYQHFVELHQQSNGDAYDRTGSLFVMNIGENTLFDGINNHPDSLPTFVGRDGQRYQGMMVNDEGYIPAMEWVRFFTPFGVGHFNDRMASYGIEWRDEAYYRQEITDVYQSGDVIVGVWIGNYDGGGHLLTVDIKSYPNDYTTEGLSQEHVVMPLFNTCNVLEMAGQNYGKLFASDSLKVDFTIPATVKKARLRYIATGHGGWDEGDEFVAKTNTILIDGKPTFTHTPWRQDCGCYRDLNPVSGNFWNGLSSSDFSRSGWCPGTATQPVYFDLSSWADGRKHTLTVAIPQGQPVEGMFSHWAVSGAVILDY